MKQKTNLRDKLRASNPFFGTSNDLPRVIEIDLAELRQNPDQPRKEFDQEALNELAASIQKHGLINPITVSKIQGEGALGFQIVAGERRYRAHQLLDRKSIAAIVTDGNPEEIALIENIQREDLNPIEEAEGLARLKERYSYTDEDLASAIGKSRPTVTNLLGITRLPQQIRDECLTSNIPVSKYVLIEVSKLKTPEEQFQLWESLKKGSMTVKGARKEKRLSPSSVAKTETEPLFEALAAGRKFVRRLADVSNPASADPAALAELHMLRGKIDELYRQLAGEKKEVEPYAE